MLRIVRVLRSLNWPFLCVVALISCCAGVALQSSICDVKQVELELQPMQNLVSEISNLEDGPVTPPTPAPVNASTQKYLTILTNRLRTQLNGFAGQKLWRTHVQALEDLISDQAWIDHAYVQRIFPNRVIVSVWTKRPILSFVRTNGDVIPIAADASTLPAISATQAPDLPVVRDSHFLSDEELRKLTVQMLGLIPETGVLSRSNIAEIGVVRGHQLWMSLIDQNFVVRMTPTDAKLKVARVTKVLEYLQNKNISARLIDADFRQKVLVKLRH